jgi:DNA-binding beta-propeller fold protein YncE
MSNSLKIVTLVAILLIIGLTGAIVFINQQETTQINVINKGNELIEAPEKRKWLDDFIVKEHVLNKDIVDSVSRGVGFKKNGDYLYVADFGDMRLKRFNLNGKYKDSFGKGMGRGPGEFQLFIGYDISQNNKMYIVDAKKRELMEFDLQTTEYITSTDIDYRPYRLIIVDNKIIIESLLEEKLFKVHSLDGSLVNEFGKNVDDHIQNSLSTIGDIQAIPDTDTFAFVASKASFMYYYNSIGKQLKSIITPDRIPYKGSVDQSAGGVRSRRAPDPAIKAYDIHISDNKVYVSLSNKEEVKNLPLSFLDVYELKSGEYLHSIELPIPTNDLVITPDLIYLLNNETESIKAYSYKN